MSAPPPAVIRPSETPARWAVVPFFLLAALLAVRPLLTELHERIELAVIEALGVTGGTTPALPALLDALQLAAAAALLAAGPVSGRRGFKMAAVGVLLLIAAVGVSACGANNPRLALNAGGTLAAFAMTGLALVCRPYPRAWIGGLLALVLASGATFALRGWLQHFIDFPDLLEEFHTRAAQLPIEAREQPEFINLERRLRSAEVYSFQAHPNIAGSCLMMWGLPAVAGGAAGTLRWGRMRGAGRRATFGLLALAVLCAGALYWTGSAGAAGAFAVGAGVLLAAALARRRGNSARGATAALVAIYFAAAAALFGYGIVNGTLPGASLAFRWYYWTAGWSAYFDAPLTGLGVGNFAAAYLLHKPPVSTEEVRNAHDLWVSLLVELGPLGVVAGILLLVAVFSNAAGALLAGDPASNGRDEASGEAVCVDKNGAGAASVGRSALFGTIAAALGVLALQAWGSDAHFDNTAWTILWLVEFALVFVVAAALVYPALASKHVDPVVFRGLSRGAAAAAIAVFVHNIVCFSLFTSAGLSLLVICLAVSRAGRQLWTSASVSGVAAAPPATSAAPRGAVSAVAGILALAHVMLVAVPTLRSQAAFDEFERAQARRAGAGTLAAIAYRAAALDPLDPAVPRQLARRLAARADSDDSLRSAAIELADLSLARDDRSTAAHEILAELLTVDAAHSAESAVGSASADTLRAALRHREAVIALYPTDPRARLKLAEAATRLYLATGESQWADTAVVQADEAVRLDRLRPDGDVVRLRQSELDRIAEVRRAIGRPDAPGPSAGENRR